MTKHSPLFIGLGHYSNTGKNTLARLLAEQMAELSPSLLVKNGSFAEKLKEVAYDLYAWAGMQDAAFYETDREARDVVLPLLGKTPVQIWVALGDCVRDSVFADTWTEYLLQQIWTADVVFVPDTRFPRECERILELGGVLIRVERPGVSPRDTRADKALLGYEGWTHSVSATNVSELRRHASRLAPELLALAPQPEPMPELSPAEGDPSLDTGRTTRQTCSKCRCGHGGCAGQ